MTGYVPGQPPAVIALVGQMGAGKSTVGKLLAEEIIRVRPSHPLKRVDLDVFIADRLGMDIASCFATHGEAYFRDVELASLQELLSSAPPGETLILATGGGAPCSDTAIAALRAAGEVIWLDVAPDLLAARALGSDRPLLAGRSLAEAAAFLAEQRTARVRYYAEAHVHLDGSQTPEALAAAIAARYLIDPMSPNAPTMPPSLEVALPAESEPAAYPIAFVDGLPGPTAAAMVDTILPSARRLLVVTDSNVGPLYASDVVAALAAIARMASVALHVVPAGEASKNLDVIAGICDAALEAGVSRYDALVALGGGVVGDLTGFAASILHRGVPVIQIPTTLLSQVDSSVGGKTGVNHSAGKNLIGTFWQPTAVISSQSVLATLSPREYRCGLAEAIKHGAIADAAFMRWIADNAAAIMARAPAALAHLVYRCCTIKRDIVVLDPRDKGERALLNFGHTLGHAYERLVGYGTLTHGEAVALGMLWAAELSEVLAVSQDSTRPSLVEPLRALLATFGFEVDRGARELPDLDALLTAALSDKKADAGGTVRFVTLRAIGEGVVTPMSWAEVRRALSQTGAGGAA